MRSYNIVILAALVTALLFSLNWLNNNLNYSAKIYLEREVSATDMNELGNIKINNKVIFVMKKFDCSRCNDSLLAIANKLHKLIGQKNMILFVIGYNQIELDNMNRIFQYTFDDVMRINGSIIIEDGDLLEKSYIFYLNSKRTYQNIYVPKVSYNSIFIRDISILFN